VTDASDSRRTQADSAYSWARLALSLLLSTIGGVGMWSVVVALPAVQEAYGVTRGDASLPYASTMIGFGLAGIVLGRLADRFGIMLPIIVGTLLLGSGFALASQATTAWQFTLAQGLAIGAGSSATFGPLLAHVSLWFARSRGIAIAIIASGNYLAGAIWPPIVQYFLDRNGLEATYLGIGAFCVASMLPLSMLLRRPAPVSAASSLDNSSSSSRSYQAFGISGGALQGLLIIAGLACCVAMSMPQVHLIAYCSDLGYGPARGAQMLSLMLACGIASRLVFGVISDRIGGLRTLLLASSLQGVALLMFLPFDGLVSLYLISALFGLFQGGIVPAYAIIVREYFPAREAGVRVSAVITATLFGMALGGWMTGVIFDFAGSYKIAFGNGILWNLLNVSIAAWLLKRTLARPLVGEGKLARP